MSLLDTIFSPALALDRRRMVTDVPLPPNADGSRASWGMLCDVLEEYYQNNALYQDVLLSFAGDGVRNESIKGLRNPAFRCVEFYASKLWPGPLEEALPIRTRNRNIIKPIEQVWRWSNWASKKQLAARYMAIFGDLIIKVQVRSEDASGVPLAVRDRRVFFEIIKPRHVTDMALDERGYVTRLRIDKTGMVRETPRSELARQLIEANPAIQYYTYTEYWDASGVRIWEHDQGELYPIDKLGPPIFQRSLEDMGIDFIPIVHAPFRDTGDPSKRGAGAYVYQLDKIDEINAQVTRLHKIMFRYGRPVWAILSNMVDATRKPMPAPRFEGSPYTGPTTGTAGISGAETWLEGEPVLYFPGLSKPELLIPQLQYQSFLEAITAQMRELEDDLPELIYYRVIREFKEPSGRALSYMLSPAVDRVIEVRGNAERALARANQIALTLGQRASIWDKQIGTYESEDETTNFDHTFATRPVIPLSDLDIAEAERAATEAYERKHNMQVPYERLWREMGYDEDEIEENKRWWAEEQDRLNEEAREKLEMEGEVQAETAGKTEELKVEANPQPPGTAGRAAGRPRGATTGSGTQSRGSPNISRTRR